MHIRFDENDDVVVENVPDDIMDTLNKLACDRDRTVEDEMRDLLVALYENTSGADAL